MFHTRNYRELTKLFFMFVLPALSSQLLSGIYTIVDGYFVGWGVGQDGLAAIGLAFPFSVIVTAIGAGIGVGGGALIAISMGRRREALAQRILGAMVFLMVAASALSSLLLTPLAEYLLTFYDVSPEIAGMARLYAWILIISSPAQVVTMAMLGAVRNDGFPRKAMFIMIAAFGTNIVLDWLWVIVFPFGIAGAAWATALAQSVSAAMVLAYLPRFKTMRLRAADFIPDLRLCARIAALGAGPMCNFLTQAVVQIFLNAALRKYGAASACGSEAALAAAGVANKANTLAAAVVTGLTNGMQPIVGYNFGRGNYTRVREAGLLVVKTVIAVSFCIFLCYQLIPRQIAALFGAGTEAYFDFAARFFRIFLMMTFLNGLQSSVGGFFSAQGKPLFSILISVARQIIFLPPLLLLLPARFGLDGVLWSGPIADLATAAIAIFLMARRCRLLEEMRRAGELRR